MVAFASYQKNEPFIPFNYVSNQQWPTLQEIYCTMKYFFPGLLMAFVLVQCTPAKMALNENDWLHKEEYQVNNRRKIFAKETMAFGEYQTISVKRSWTKGYESRYGWSIGNPTDYNYQNVLSWVETKKKQTLKFAMADAKGDSSEVFCLTKASSDYLQIGKNENNIVNIATELFLHNSTSSNTFYIRLYTNKYSKPWELLFDNEAWAGKPQKYIGIVAMNKDNYYTLKPITQMQGKDGKAANILFGAVGLEIRNKQDKPVAAVSMLDKGVVYLSDLPAEERFLLANICAALLMQDQIG